MLTLLNIQKQNTQIKDQLSQVALKVNHHYELIQAHDQRINNVDVEISDVQDVLACRHPTSKLKFLELQIM